MTTNKSAVLGEMYQCFECGLTDVEYYTDYVLGKFHSFSRSCLALHQIDGCICRVLVLFAFCSTTERNGTD